jgi:serine protease
MNVCGRWSCICLPGDAVAWRIERSEGNHSMTRVLSRTAKLGVLALVAAALAAIAAPAATAKGFKTIPTLRVMIAPTTAPRGTLPDAMKSRLEALAGVPVTVIATTRTGAVDLALGGPRDRASLEAVAKALRADRNVLWAETRERTIQPKSGIDSAASQLPGRKLMVRLADGADAKASLARIEAAAGAPLTHERTIGNVQIYALAQATTLANLEAIARKVEGDPLVRHADPVRRVVPHALPNDPLFAQQWSLDTVNAAAAWTLGTGHAGMVVAVVDTGILPHPDLDGRVLPGHDFISDAERARDGDGRDANARDEGDWLDAADCGGFGSAPSFFHGLFVAGQIAATGNNGEGIAGLDWAAKILPVRVLGKCGGTIEDVLAGVLWASGVPIDGAPQNRHPAKVINLSLGGFGECAAAIQESIDDALAQGSVVIASAGNESDDASLYSPANCSGVITVGALSRSGNRSSYSNFGRRIDISAPGGDGDVDGLILSTHYTGTTVPGEPAYDFGMGTSFSAPLVSGTVSLMLARNPNLTAGQVLATLQGTTRDFPAGSACGFAGFCGAGILDAGFAIQSTVPAITNPPEGAVAVVEFHDAALDHYLITADANEMALLDTQSRWQRTGYLFYAWQHPSQAPAGTSPRPVCRFHAGAEHQIDSHYFTADAAECDFVRTRSADVWTLQNEAAFWIEVPDAAGQCRDGTLPVYRFFNARRDANQRFTTDLSVRRGMLNRVWVADGPGANGAAFCALI